MLIKPRNLFDVEFYLAQLLRGVDYLLGAERPESHHQRMPAANAHNPRRSIESTSLGEGTADADTSDCGGI